LRYTQRANPDPRALYCNNKSDDNNFSKNSNIPERGGAKMGDVSMEGDH
jgi:hypothetical protein